MLDAAAKKANLPLCDYIGGRVRDKIEFAAYLFFKMADENGRGEVSTGDTLTPEQFVRQGEEFVEKYGFRQLKIKGGFFHPDVDIETFRLLRQRFPKSGGYEIRIDPNANWNVDTAIRVVKEVEQYEPQYLEDLCGPLEQNYELKKHTSVPTASNMCVSAFAHVRPNVRRQGIDVILGDHHHWGGILSYVEAGVLCRVFGFGLSGHSNNAFGVSQAAMVHAYAATPELSYGADSHYPWTDSDGDIIKGPKLKFEDGSMAVPDGPGLGVEVDQDKVDEYAEIYKSGAIRRRADLVRSLDPLWPWGRPRW
jgi:glucarate dehydratase